MLQTNFFQKTVNKTNFRQKQEESIDIGNQIEQKKA